MYGRAAALPTAEEASDWPREDRMNVVAISQAGLKADPQEITTSLHISANVCPLDNRMGYLQL